MTGISQSFPRVCGVGAKVRAEGFQQLLEFTKTQQSNGPQNKGSK